MSDLNDRFYHAHRIIQERCDGRLHCVRCCPTRAIRVRDNRVTFYNDLCIDCGECVIVCPQKVFEPVSDRMEDFRSFKLKVALPSNILYTQFGPEVSPMVVNRALLTAGFHEVADVSGACAEVSLALVHHLETNPDTRPLVSSFCPAVVRLIQVAYPNLVKHIAPLDVPREIKARRTRQFFSKERGIPMEEIGVIYITPCTAKTISIKQPAEKEKSWIDGAISIRDIYNLISPEIIRIQKEGPSGENNFHFGKAWGILGHFSQNVGAERSISVAGLGHVKKILDDIENDRLKNIDFVEALACFQGCLGGMFCVTDSYVARHNSIQLQKRYGKPVDLDMKKVLEQYKQGYYFSENPVMPRTTRVYQPDIALNIKRLKMKERMLAKLPKNDCGICGAPTCECFADDCARGEADVTDCIFFKSK